MLGSKRTQAAPQPGRSLLQQTEKYAGRVRRAVAGLESAVRESSLDPRIFRTSYSPRLSLSHELRPASLSASRIAWMLANIHLLASVLQILPKAGSMTSAEDWFCAGASSSAYKPVSGHLSPVATREAAALLEDVAREPDLLEFLPYVLDPLENATRLSVMRDPSKGASREARRRSGNFYTPADVANYMVQASTRDLVSLEGQTVLDPAAGSGVFLVACLRATQLADPNALLRYAVKSLFAFDINATALDSCAFVLLHECFRYGALELNPLSAWHALRLNMASVDATRVDVLGWDEGVKKDVERRYLKHALLQSSLPSPEANHFTCAAVTPGAISLGTIFPEIGRGVSILVGNPPYAAVPSQRQSSLFAETGSAAMDDTVNAYPYFIEMMWRLTERGNNSSALVVPLSIAYSQGVQYVSCREAMARAGGRWRCAFFDREPHALFGEEVKTRAAILFRSEGSKTPPRGERADISTTALLKWTSKTRASLFDSVSFASLGCISILNGIPKVGSEDEALVYRQLRSSEETLGSVISSAESVRLEDVPSADAGTTVFVGKTAYNFLNVFRSVPQEFKALAQLAENGVMAFHFDNEELSSAAYAVLSSFVVFWLWRVEGDGFHVTRRFIERIPFGRSVLTLPRIEAFALLGDKIWHDVRGRQVISVNAGRRSIAFSSLGIDGRGIADEIILRAAGVGARFSQLFTDYAMRAAAVDANAAPREHHQLRRLATEEVK